MKPIQVLLAVVLVLVSLTGQAMVKAGLNQVRVALPQPKLTSIVSHAAVNPSFVGGFLLVGFGAVLYMTLLYYTDFTRALPVMGAVAYTMIPVYGYFFLRENITGSQLAGLALLLVSIWLLRK